MTDKIRKWKDEASTLLRKGKYQKALVLFQKVIEQDPDDLSCYNNVGYIQRKLGMHEEAIKTFVELAESYAQRGFLLKGIATCKVVLEIDPGHKDVQKKLAELYSNRSGDQKPAEVKVMAEPESEAKIGDEAVVPLEPISFDEIELAPLPEGDHSIQLTTPLDDIQPDSEPEPEPEPEEEPPSEPSPELEPIELDTGGIPDEPLPEPPPEPEGISLDEHAPLDEPVEPEPIPLEETAPEPSPPPTPQPPTPAEPASEAREPASEGRPEPELESMPDVDIDLDLDTMELDQVPKEEMTLPEIPLFSDLEPDAFVEILEKMKMVRMKAGDWILREGDQGSSMFTIASGAVRVLKRLEGKKMLQLAVLGEGAFFGEMSVLRGGPRGASVQAVKPGELFELSKELLDKVVERYPTVEEVLKKFAKQRLLRNVLNTSDLFKPFSKEDRVKILERFVSRDIDMGEVLIDEGKESPGFFIVLRGKMDVLCKMEDDSTVSVGELAEGEVFGEISCLHREPAVATVKAATPASILRLPRSDFNELILSHPQILELVNSLGDQRRAITMNALAKKGILI